MARTAPKQLIVCIKNDGYLASLDSKIYVALRDAQPAENPKQRFRLIVLPQTVEKGVLNAA